MTNKELSPSSGAAESVEDTAELVGRIAGVVCEGRKVLGDVSLDTRSKLGG